MTWRQVYRRVTKGEIFEDPDILRLANNIGLTIAHTQACGDNRTVLDFMLKNGWEPKTEEEKLIVFTVKAGG